METPIHAADPLTSPVIRLTGVGPERAAQLARIEVQTIRDLLWLRPRRYEDRRQMLPIAQLQLQQSAAVRGRVVDLGIKRFSRGSKSVFVLILDDGTARLHCRWWNLPYMRNYFREGDEVLVYGKLLGLKPRTLDHPETEVIDPGQDTSIHLNRIVPVYPLTEGLPQRWLRALVWRTLEEFHDRLVEPWKQELAPEFSTRNRAVQMLHFPTELNETEAARRRLAIEELTSFQLSLQLRRRTLMAKATGKRCRGTNRLVKPFLAGLGFGLTQAQIKVMRELRRDMDSGCPMRRLLQGDVGSGKTVVAACAALICLESGASVALMAPTEILAQQHYRNFKRWFEPLGLAVHLQTGSIKTLEDAAAAPLTEGTVPSTTAARPVLVVGTHALVESSFALENLGLTIIDEQHRFGVAQRELLVRKGDYPHLLVMTATPIPRTLGLTLYGDLDLSILDELPAGRSPVKTFVRADDSLGKVWAFVRSKLEEGRQAYVVLPRVEESGPGVKAVTKEFAGLVQELAPWQVRLLHGRLSASEKETVMAGFRDGAIHVLLSTSLIEVGIDVPNATVMVIVNAEQFGLAQLHQLRGRIGRGSHASYCILVTQAKTPESKQRLEILAQTSDGFRIAEGDLKLRGPGDFLGHQQSGLPPFQFADLSNDLDLVERSKLLAVKLLE
jgi:ATP-dependent DNA helicase RecG